ncbi:cupin domain-containing protein [Bordetella genomosp. 11]|uniref:cupin domain-containing protein n=1 Tax=Bordetella genomosp. 11 TaxID=1416808 RepID=UPI0015958F51|nr:cupin domain-containing protein [Bordetella genomosp. 11]
MDIKKTATKLRGGIKPAAAGKTAGARTKGKEVTKPSVKARARAEAADAARDPLRIGSKLKHARLLQGYTLKELADIVECSESMLSKLENDKLASSIGFLHRLANALGTSIAELYSAEDTLSGPVHVFHASRRARSVADPDALDQGVRFERIVPIDRNGLLQALVHSIPPGARSGDTVSHAGEELGYIIEGEVEVTVDGKSYVVRQGDLIFFPSSLPHGYCNKGDKMARMLKVNTPPSL